MKKLNRNSSSYLRSSFHLTITKAIVWRRAISAFFVIAFCTISMTVTEAATYTVNTVSDSIGAVCPVNCTLRKAISTADSTPEDDVIEFESPLFDSPQTIILTSDSGNQIQVSGSGKLTINGPGANLLTIFQGVFSRVFYIEDSAHVEINDVTISGGNAGGATGGAIFSRGTITIDSSTITNNSSGGGALAISRQFGGNGRLTLKNSTVSHNTGFGSWAGGGILNLAGTIIIINSTISHNQSYVGAGIRNFGGSTLTVINSTITNNISTGGRPGGGIESGSVANFANTIVAGNTNPSGSPDVDGVFASAGFNLIGDGSGSSGFTATGDQVGTSGSPIDPMLGPLTNNGGPTETHALLAGSPTIDAGSDDLALDEFLNPLSNDQRGIGYSRIFNTSVDIGAFELQEGANQSPIADAGINQIVTATGIDGAQVMLDGSASFDPDDDTLAYSWEGSFGTVTGVMPHVTIPPGTHIVTLTVDDGLGGVATDEVVIEVVFEFDGFFAPIENAPTYNTVKAGSAVPLKWRIPDGQGGLVSDVAAVTAIQYTVSGCPNSAEVPSNPVAADTSGNSGLRFDEAEQKFIYVWKTPKALKGQCADLFVQLADGNRHYARFSFK